MVLTMRLKSFYLEQVVLIELYLQWFWQCDSIAFTTLFPSSELGGVTGMSAIHSRVVCVARSLEFLLLVAVRYHKGNGASCLNWALFSILFKWLFNVHDIIFDSWFESNKTQTYQLLCFFVTPCVSLWQLTGIVQFMNWYRLKMQSYMYFYKNSYTKVGFGLKWNHIKNWR